MTLDEAIKHCEEKADEIRKANEEMPTDCKLSEDLCECAKEHEQLAEWLKDYKRLLEEQPQGEWITRHKQNMLGNDVVCFECNKCGECRVPLYHLLITEPLGVCPNCGADMRGEEK